MRRLIVIGLLTAACSSASPAQESSNAALSLANRASSADKIAYKVTYDFNTTGPLAPAVRTKMTVVVRPPNSLRRIETTTVDRSDKPTTAVQWFVESSRVFTSCYSLRFPDQSPTCLEGSRPSGPFGFRQVDEIFELARDPDSFKSVKIAEDRRIAGQRAECYEARPKTQAPLPTPVGDDFDPTKTAFDPTDYRFDLCYTSDGVLLYFKRTAIKSRTEPEGRGTSVLEAKSFSRTVRTADLRVPGQVVRPSELISSPSPSASPK